MSSSQGVVLIKGSSGNVADVNPSGQVSVTGSLSVSGNSVNANISGQTVNANISGQTVSLTPGTTIIAQTSGQTVNNIPTAPTAVITSDDIVIQSLSGGTRLPSGLCVSVTIKHNSSQSGIMKLGGIGSFAPYSGRGLSMDSGDSYTAAINNPNALSVFATVSGEKVSYIANQQ